jgi:hypothetical protein
MNFSATAAATRAPVIPLISELNVAEVRNAHIVHTVNVGTNNDPVREKRKMEVPMADKPNAELILRTVEEFHDVASAGRLNLSTGPLKFAKFRECLGGSIRDQWDVVKVLQATETNDTFKAAVNAFLLKYLRESDLMKQRLYMDTTPKPFRLSVQELAARYQFLNNLMKWFPTANDVKPYDDDALKFLLHTAMLQDWKDNFGRSNLGFQSSYEDIVNYFSEQEQIHNRIRSRNESRGGRGRGRFQSNQGRGGRQGRGYYRGNYSGNYNGPGRGYYNNNPSFQGYGGSTPPPSQYRRLDTPPSRVSNSSSSQGSAPAASPGRFGGYSGQFNRRFGGRGRFQPRTPQQGAHYVDHGVYYAEPQPAPQDHQPSTSVAQANYLVDEYHDAQEYYEDQEAYFANYNEDPEGEDGVWY